MSLRLSYRGKLLVNFVLLFVCFAAILVLTQYHRESTYRRELFETRLRSYADIVANGVETQSADEPVDKAIDDIFHALPPEVRITVISKQGQVRYETDSAAYAKASNHADRPEVKQAFTQAEGSDIRLSETTGLTYFYYAKSYGGFIVRVALPYNDSVRNLLQVDNVYLWFVLLVFAVVLFVIIRVSDHFGKAVSSLRRFINSAERGLVDYDHISFPNSELGEIGKSIMLKYQQLEKTGSQIAAERERLMRHFHYFEEGIAIFSPDRKKIYANPRFVQYVNTIAERPTPNVNTLWEEESFRPALDFLNLASHDETASADEAPVFRFTLTTGGNYFTVQILVYGDGGFEMTIADITRAEKNKRLKQQMSNNITHELRTPVSSIRGYIETLLECDTLTAEKRRHFLERAHAQVARLTDLIRDVALISKTEEAPDTMPREVVCLSPIVDDIEEELRASLTETHITVHNNIPPTASLQGNYTLVYSIFRNLIENSIRYAGEGAEIHVECYKEDSEYVYFRYFDTGQGVPEEHLPRLFERFYRVSEGRTRDGGGTGLGLSIVRNAVLFHSGNISVRNRKPHGLEFLFTLKRA